MSALIYMLKIILAAIPAIMLYVFVTRPTPLGAAVTLYTTLIFFLTISNPTTED